MRPSRWERTSSWIFSTDPVRVGVMWIASTLAFFFLGGIAAMMIRAELTFPGQTFMDPEDYAAWFTLHGTMMVFFFAVPVFFGIGSILVPRMIGSDNLAFPRLNTFDLYLIVLGGLILEVGFLMGERPMAGWTSYTPLSLGAFSPGRGQDWWIWGVLIETVGGTLAGINFVVTILRNRRPGLRMRRLPVFVWTMLFTGLLTLLAGPFLITGLLLMFLDRNAGTFFFHELSVHGTLLWQDLFWFYSHPATYVMVIPAFGIVTAIIARFAARPIFSYAAIVISSAAVFVLSFLVWWHHMFITGMGQHLRMFGAVATWAISVPAGVLVFTWLASMWKGRIRFTTPMLFALGWILMFTIGGANGVYLAYIPFDHYAHDTYWLVAHFHYIIFGGTVLGIFAAIYYWFPSALHLKLDEGLGKLHFWGTLVGMNVTFFPMHFLGFMGMPRRVFDYNPEFALLNVLQSAGMFITAAAMLVFLANVAITMSRRTRVIADPWGPHAEWGIAGGERDPLDEKDAEGRGGLRSEIEPDAAIHATHPQMHAVHAQSRWPAVLGFAFLFIAVGVTGFPLAFALGLVLFAVGIVGVSREVAQAHRVRTRGGDDEERDEVGQGSHDAREDDETGHKGDDRASARGFLGDRAGDRLQRRTKHWWLAFGLAASTAMIVIALLRAFVAHGLLHPDHWPEAGRDIATLPSLLATLAIAGVAVMSHLGLRAQRARDDAKACRFLLAAPVLGVAYLALVLLDWTAFLEAGFSPSTDAAGSGYYALTGLFMLLVFGLVLMLVANALRARRGEFGGGRHEVVESTSLYALALAAMWIAVFLVVHLRLVVWEGRFLL